MQKVFPVFESKGFRIAENRKNSRNQLNTGIARKLYTSKVPFENRIIWPTSNTQSGSFGSRALDPALVRNQVSDKLCYLDEFRRI